jgi:hypothetical protein
MPIYHFTLRNDVADNEDLGYLAMTDDEALIFGRTIIRDLMRKRHQEYVGSAMDITEGKRSVGSLWPPLTMPDSVACLIELMVSPPALATPMTLVLSSVSSNRFC